MSPQEYLEFILKQQKMITPEIKDAILEQMRLSKIAIEKQTIRDKIEEKSYELISKGYSKLLEKYPDIESRLSLKDNMFDAMKFLFGEFLKQSDNYKYVTEKMKEIPELVENEKLQDALGKANYEYFNALTDLNNQIASDRLKFFSLEYRKKMDEFADKGILLYFLETPDIDLLDVELTEQILIESFCFNEYESIKILLERYVNIPNPSPIMMRKSEDLICTVNLLIDGYYRAASRNIFALLESEHKRCADAFEGFFEKKKTFKKGHERAKKISELLNKINIEWEQHSWEKINEVYKKIFASENSDGICYRNGIIHGDYYDKRLDINDEEIVKLILLWLNIRLLADALSNLEDELNNILSYLTGYAISKES